MSTKQWSRAIWFSLGVSTCLGFLLVCFIFIPAFSVGFIEEACSSEGCASDSAIAIAASIGRLDVVSLLLGVLGIGIGFFVIFSFVTIKEHAEIVAERTARETAIREVQRRMDWLQTTMHTRLEPDRRNFDEFVSMADRSAHEAKDDG